MKSNLLSTAHIASNLAALFDKDNYLTLPVNLIDPDPKNPRRDWTSDDAVRDFDSLKSSIQAVGVKTPISVVRKPDLRYQIISGERRWRASVELGLADIPTIERIKSTVKESKIEQIIENLVRRNLNIIENAESIQALIAETVFTRNELCAALGWSETTMSKQLGLLKLPTAIQQVAIDGKVKDINTLTALASLDSDELEHHLAAIEAGTFNAIVVHEKASEIRKKKGSSKPKKPPMDPNIVGLMQRLEDHLHAPIKFKHNPQKNAGSLTISYFSLDELDGILKHLQLPTESEHD